MLTKVLSGAALGLVLSFALWSSNVFGGSTASPCACCGPECVCEDCLCDELGCDCDTGGECVCPVPCCSHCL